MTLCIAFFLCLISVLSYDLVQVKSSGCWRRYSIPFHGSKDSSLYVLHIFFPRLMPPWHSDGCVFLTIALLLHRRLESVFFDWFSPNISSNSVRSDSMNHSLLIPGCWNHPQGLIQPRTKSSVLNSSRGSHFPTRIPPVRILHLTHISLGLSDQCQWKPGLVGVCVSRVVHDPLLLGVLSHMQRGPGTVDAMGPYVGISWPGSWALCQSCVGKIDF